MAKPSSLPSQATTNADSHAHLPTELPPADPPPPPQPEVGPPPTITAAVTDPEDFVHEISGGATEGRGPVIVGTVDGLLGGPDTSIAIELHLRPPASDTADIEAVQAFDHLHLHLQFDLIA
jgi:hypothetical protein